MNRRQFLLSVVNLDKYKDLLFNSVYFNTIYDADIKDKGKIKLGEIEGNGEIVNQLQKPFTNNFTASGVTFSTSNDGRKLTLSGSANSWWVYDSPTVPTPIPIGHKILVVFHYTNPNNISGYYLGYRVRNSQNSSQYTDYIGLDNNIITTTFSTDYIQFYGGSTSTIDYTGVTIYDVQLIDLTLMFGTGNEPTALTDNRIQNILNGDYIPYNTGSYKPSIVKEIEMQPYNLFDGEWETYSSTQMQSANFTKIVSGFSYDIESTKSGTIMLYDKDQNYLDYYSLTQNGTRTLTLNCEYVKFRVNATESGDYICFHRTSSRTGYAPYFEPIKLNHFTPNKAGSVSDTYKDFVFTRKVGFVDLGTLSWTYDNANTRFYTFGISSSIKIGSSNIYCAKYQTASDMYNITTNKTIGVYPSNGNLIIKDTDYTDATVFKNSLSGVILYYELATPTTITMANNCLQCVDLGTLSWGTPNSIGRTGANDIKNIVKKPSANNIQANIYCPNYLSKTADQTYVGNIGISIQNDGAVHICDSLFIGKTAEQVAAALSGIYLFYETASPLNEFDADVLINEMKITLPKALSLGGAISAHNTFEITKTAYVFTRNVSTDIDMGALTWQQGSTSGSTYSIRWRAYFTSFATSVYQNTGNVICDKYTTVDFSGATALMSGTKDKCCALSDNSRLDIVDSAFDSYTAEQVKTALSGYTFRVKLALSQVTTIARKRLKAVDLGTLTYTYEDGVFKVQISDMITGNPGVNKTFIDEYLFELITTLSNMGDRHYARNSNWLYIKDTRYNNATNFKNAVSGITLWYETNADVSDLTDKALFEKGGTITTNEFSWVKNQQLIIPTISSTTTNDVTITNNNDGSVTISGTASANTTFTLMGNLSRSIPLGHKVFITNFANANHLTYYMWDAYESNISYDMEDSPNGYIKTKEGSNTIISPRIYVRSGTNISTPQTLRVMYIDLTQAFGAGNEPTSTDDYRIQKILQMGYIPTDTNGTQESVQTEVLCNLDMKVQK